jgi:hypothetical protein
LTIGSTLDIDKEIKEEVVFTDPTTADAASDIYTGGGELITEDGQDYVGYYHIHIDEEGDSVYMEGAYHTDAQHGILRVSADKIEIPIGDVDWLNIVPSSTSSQPFRIGKYISVGGQQYYDNTEVRNKLVSEAETAGLVPSETNISDLYPGTMELAFDEDGNEVGITGELGVRYGLEFYVQDFKVVSVEVDALDLPVEQFQPLDGKTKLLLCLVNNLLDDPDFNAIVKYVFPLNKILSTIAIYNDMAFVPSVGEIVSNYSDSDDPREKPGRFVLVEYNGTDEETGAPVLTASASNGGDGWFSTGERSPGLFVGNGLFLLHYDKWDQNIFTKI